MQILKFLGSSPALQYPKLLGCSQESVLTILPRDSDACFNLRTVPPCGVCFLLLKSNKNYRSNFIIMFLVLSLDMSILCLIYNKIKIKTVCSVNNTNSPAQFTLESQYKPTYFNIVWILFCKLIGFRWLIFKKPNFLCYADMWSLLCIIKVYQVQKVPGVSLEMGVLKEREETQVNLGNLVCLVWKEIKDHQDSR